MFQQYKVIPEKSIELFKVDGHIAEMRTSLQEL